MRPPCLQPPPLPSLVQSWAGLPVNTRARTSYLSLGPVGAAGATMAAACRAPPWQIRLRAAQGTQLHRFPPWEEPGASKTRFFQPGPQRPGRNPQLLGFAETSPRRHCACASGERCASVEPMGNRTRAFRSEPLALDPSLWQPPPPITMTCLLAARF